METPSQILHVAPLLLDVFWKSLFVFAVAALAALVLRRRSAAARHALWLSAFVTLLFLPALCLWLPGRTLPVLPADASPPRPLLPVQSMTGGSALFLTGRPAAQLPAHSLESQTDRATASQPLPAEAVPVRAVRPDPATWPALLWVLGVGVVLGRLALGLASARRLIRGCVPVCTGPLAEAAGEARRALGLTRPVRLRQDTANRQAVAVPMTFGHLRPVVLLPPSASDWPAGRLRAVLLHEMAHIGRGDWASLLLAQTVCALYWFHPLVWLAARRVRAEAEEACDDRVLLCGVPAPDYADHLLEIVRALPRRGGRFPAAVTMARNREIAGRLQTILAHPKSRGGVTRRGLILAALAGPVLVLPLAAMHPARRPAPARVQTVAALTGAPWTARLSDGTLLKLVAVSRVDRHGHDVGVSWTPDGGPLGGTAKTAGGNPLVALVNSLFDRAGDVSLHMAAMSSKPYMVVAASESDNRRGHANVGLRVSTGPFTTFVSAPLGRSVSRRLPSGETVALSKATTGLRAGPLAGRKPSVVTQVWLTVPVRFNTPDYDSRLEAVEVDGKVADLPTFPQGADGSGPTRRLLYLYQASDLKSRHVTTLRFVTRPADHFTFRDVALQPNLPIGALVPVSQVFDPLDEDPAARNRARQQRIATALHLRGRLQGWAVRNAALLRRMRQANPDDFTALLNVYAQVPPTRTSAGEAAFTGLGAPPTPSHLRRSQEPLDIDLREDFARYRDFRLSQSINTGRTFITLWASGRVTETTLTDRTIGRAPFFGFARKDTADIAPAYPFLR